MDHKDEGRRTFLGLGLAWTAVAGSGLAGCGGGGGGEDSNTPPPVTPPPTGLAAPSLEGVPAKVDGLQVLDLPLALADPASSYILKAEIGGGVVIELENTAPAGAQPVYRFVAPAGALDSQRNFGNGTVRLVLTRKVGAQSVQTLYTVAVDMPTASEVAGTATLRHLRAVQLNAQRSLANLGILGSKLDSGLALAETAAAANQLRQRFADMEGIVRDAMAGRPAILDFGTGSAVALTSTLLRQLDACVLGLQKLVPPVAMGSRAGAKILSASPLASDDDDEVAFARDLADSYASSARTVAKRVKDYAGLGAAILAGAAVVTGSVPLAVAAGGIAATAWWVSTAFGTGVGAVVDGGSAKLLDGQATWQDFAPSGKFFVDQYLDLAKDYAIGLFAKLPVDGKLAPVIEIGTNALSAYQSTYDDKLKPAFDGGQLSKGGYPPSTFELRVTASANPYIVVALAIPDTGGRVRLQISGTDGYVFNQDATLAGGRATFNPQPASPGSGIVDTINVFDLDGRSSASTSVTF